LLTNRTARFGTPVSVTVQDTECGVDASWPDRSEAPSSAATSANRRRSSSTSNGSESARTTWRVKNHPLSTSEW
jgi:hypothetical protein